MAVKHHCIICGNLIFSGMYCSGCSREITRSRTLDDEPFEDWISRIRFTVIRFATSSGGAAPLESYDHSGI